METFKNGSRVWFVVIVALCALVVSLSGWSPFPAGADHIAALSVLPLIGLSASNAFENKLLSLYLENADAANIGDATGLRGSTTAGVVYVSIHTGSPGETGNQATSEAAYTSYARVSVARSTSGWTVASGVGDNDAAITFPGATGGSETETYFALGSASSGAGNLDIYGALSASLAVSSGITPEFAAGALDISLD